MKVNLSHSYSQSESVIVNNIIQSVFLAKASSVEDVDKDRVFSVSPIESDSPDFVLNVSKFLSDNSAHKGILFKELALSVFGEYVDPRTISSNYGKISSNSEENTQNTVVTKVETIKTVEDIQPSVEEKPVEVIVPVKDNKHPLDRNHSYTASGNYFKNSSK
jgi:hypothetical protein